MEMIEGLVHALREGDDWAKAAAARTLGDRAFYDVNDRVAIGEAGGIPRLVELLRDGSADAKLWAVSALGNLRRNNNANTVAIAAAAGLEALVQLARRGSVSVENRWLERATWKFRASTTHACARSFSFARLTRQRAHLERRAQAAHRCACVRMPGVDDGGVSGLPPPGVSCGPR